MKRKALRPLPAIDFGSVESKMVELIEKVEPKKLAGADKKKVVIEHLAQWFDDALKLPWYLEPFDKLVAKAVLGGVYWIVGGWLESVFQRWKAKLPSDVQADLADAFVSDEAPKKKKGKDAVKP